MQTHPRVPAILWALAACLPLVHAFDLEPIVGTVPQIIAVLCWACAVLAQGLAGPGTPFQGVWPKALLSLLAGLALLALTQSLKFSATPDGGLLAAAALLSAAAVFWTVSRQARSLPSLATALFHGLLLAGLLNALVVLLQVCKPDWADDIWVASGALPGRGNGNLRQPNHLATVLLWSAVSLAALVQLGKLRFWAAIPLLALLMLALVLSASRMGMAICLLCGLWAGFDSSMAKYLRRLLALAPVLALFAWLVAGTVLAVASAAPDGDALALNQKLTSWSGQSTRVKVWTETLHLILQNPLWGVGWGEFNFAWTLSPKSPGQVHYFGNAHNLPLQLAVELGLVMATVILTVLVYVCFGACRSAIKSIGDMATVKRAALMMIGVVAIHSMLEFPLWYVTLLLPTAMLLGLCAAHSPQQEAVPVAGKRLNSSMIFGALMVVAASFAAFDYFKIVPLTFAEARASSHLQQEHLKRARSSVLYSWVGYRATARGMPGDPFAVLAAQYSAHGALDVPLLMIWADALNAGGHVDEARFLAQRIAEFSKLEGARYFLPCQQVDSAPKPYQCMPPDKTLGFRDFR